MATPAFAAPEVLAGAAPTTASDVYSLAKTITAVVDAPDSILKGERAGVVTAAMSESPEARPDAAALADGLRRELDVTGNGTNPTLLLAAPLAAPPPQKPPPPDPAPRRGLSPVLLAVGLLAAVAVGLALFGLIRGDQERTADAVVTPEVTTTLAPVTTTTPIPTTTVPPTTTTPPPPPEEQTRNQLQAVLISAPEMDADEVARVMEDVDQAIEAAAEGNERRAERELSEAARRLDREVGDDEARDDSLSLIAALADQLGIDIDQGNQDDDD
jgi:hypothetical protein